jgi:hypothetical protein
MVGAGVKIGQVKVVELVIGRMDCIGTVSRQEEALEWIEYTSGVAPNE